MILLSIVRNKAITNTYNVEARLVSHIRYSHLTGAILIKGSLRPSTCCSSNANCVYTARISIRCTVVLYSSISSCPHKNRTLTLCMFTMKQMQ